MIYTVTFNPSLDYYIELDNLSVGKVNRTNNEHFVAGGKGINVSTVLKSLDVDSMALGFVGGFTGEKIENEVRALHIQTGFIHLKTGDSRVNVKILSGHETTDLNAAGPVIPEEDFCGFLEKIKCLKNDDILVLSGSLSGSMSKDAYAKVMKAVSDRGVRVVVDTAGEALINTLSLNPYLIKPNIDELNDIFKIKCKTRQEVVEAAKKLQSRGARNVLVSLGEKGAIFICENGEIYEQDAPIGEAKSTVGAGDSMVAGFIYGLLLKCSNKPDYKNILKYAVAAGSATVFSRDLADGDSINELYGKLK